MEQKLLFYSNFNKYTYDGKNYWETPYYGEKKLSRMVSRKRVEEIAKINNATGFLP